MILCLLLSCMLYAQQDSIMPLHADTALALQDSAVVKQDSALALQDSAVVKQEVVAGHLHVDTMQINELTHRADDSYLLNIVGLQSASIKAKEDSIHQYRLLHDTTSLMAQHIGYADSIRIAQALREQYFLSPLCLPLLYMPAEPLHFSELSYAPTLAHTDEPIHLAKNVRAETRRYITTRAAALYVGVLDTATLEQIPTKNTTESKSLYELYVPEKSLIKDTEADRKERLAAIKNKNNPWYKELNTLLQFTQNYVSKNWYEGGNSALAMYGSLKGKIIYDDKKRISWENTGEWVAGFSTVSGDTLRKVNTTDDLFRLYSKLGVKVVQKLYVSATAEFRTQLFRTYNANQMTIKNGPFTPVRVNIAVGIDYKPIKNLSLVISPLAYKMVCAADTVRSNYTSYGIEAGKKALNQVGSSVRMEWKWKPLREIQLESNLYLYTNYKAVELDLEVSCDFIINRFMSARVMLHPRYDSARIVNDDDKAKMQFKELISLGFAHKFY